MMFGVCEFMGEIYTYKGPLRYFIEVNITYMSFFAGPDQHNLLNLSPKKIMAHLSLVQ